MGNLRKRMLEEEHKRCLAAITCRAATSVNINELTKNFVITVSVKRLTRFRFRFWLMAKLLALAAFVSPVEMNIESE